MLQKCRKKLWFLTVIHQQLHRRSEKLQTRQNVVRTLLNMGSNSSIVENCRKKRALTNRWKRLQRADIRKQGVAGRAIKIWAKKNQPGGTEHQQRCTSWVCIHVVCALVTGADVPYSAVNCTNHSWLASLPYLCYDFWVGWHKVCLLLRKSMERWDELIHKWKSIKDWAFKNISKVHCG